MTRRPKTAAAIDVGHRRVTRSLVAVRSPHPLVRVIDPLAVRVVVDVGSTSQAPPTGGR